MPTYLLPDLPYDYSALEPHISGRIMELHHDKHHQTYVSGANQTQEKLAEARARDDFSTIAGLEHKLAFHVSGHVLHSIFWQNLSPAGGGRPSGALGDAITREFGDFDIFKKQLVQAAMTTMGSGWAALVYEPMTRGLLVTQIHDHQSQVPQASVPLMVLDAWEHAYYLQYENNKGAFFEAVWNVWNWEDIARRYEAAQRLSLNLTNIVRGAHPAAVEQYVAH